jgi:hypothetical protein
LPPSTTHPTTHNPQSTGNSDSIDLGGIAGDIQDIVSSFGKVPKLGQVQSTLRSLTLDIIQASQSEGHLA